MASKRYDQYQNETYYDRKRRGYGKEYDAKTDGEKTAIWTSGATRGDWIESKINKLKNADIRSDATFAARVKLIGD